MQLFIFTFLFFIAPFASAQAQNPEAVLKDNMAMAQKLEDIAAPVLVGHPDLCGSYIRDYYGIEFMTRDSVGKTYQELVAKHYGVGDYPTITILGKGSPADGKLQAGDSIRSANGKVLRRGKDGQYALEDILAAGGEISLRIIRKDAEQKINLTPAKICGAVVRLEPSDEDKIYAEKGKVFVSKGALRKRSESALAVEIKSQLSRYKR